MLQRQKQGHILGLGNCEVVKGFYGSGGGGLVTLPKSLRKDPTDSNLNSLSSEEAETIHQVEMFDSIKKDVNEPAAKYSPFHLAHQTGVPRDLVEPKKTIIGKESPNARKEVLGPQQESSGMLCGGCHQTEMLGVRNDDQVSAKVVLSFWKADC
ncbi:hypothetical protein PILCRDRAFT_91572 [Piloderma croceum F 1598]|uniref:Uncharacterized protein n=1 Tax=Piloderma croceum (strain F 1598) TaxID=765440 RepID=A0A0C3EVC8_PILCF|nr:hypothetical protein PILCRDRAFT_91572 [Piloderma croceum F 1598]